MIRLRGVVARAECRRSLNWYFLAFMIRRSIQSLLEAGQRWQGRRVQRLSIRFSKPDKRSSEVAPDQEGWGVPAASASSSAAPWARRTDFIAVAPALADGIASTPHHHAIEIAQRKSGVATTHPIRDLLAFDTGFDPLGRDRESEHEGEA